MFKYKYSKLYWFFKDLEWVKVYFSPFKFFLPKLYIGKTKIGTPMFLPRKWVNLSQDDVNNKALDYYNNPKYISKTLEDWKSNFKNSQKSIPKKIGFDFVGLGWKTKFNSFRHEYNPVWSFVAFGYQIALIFIPEHDIHYFECWLAYEYDTDKSKSQKERLKEAIKKHPCVWTSYSNDEKTKTDYWKLILTNYK